MTSLAQRQAPKHADWLNKYELVAEITSSEHCANFIQTGQTFVFDLKGVLKADKSTANLCLGMLARIQPGLVLAADRASLGVHPVSPGWQTFDCFDTRLDHGGMGKVCVRVHLRDAQTGEIVTDAANPQPRP